MVFEIAIICALCEEYDAVKAILDEVYDGDTRRKGPNDPNSYTLAKISTLNVVLCLLPRMGKEHAASGSAYFRTSFPDIKLCLLVGICAGSPFNNQDKAILLGDIIVSTDLVQSDFGRQWVDGISRKDTISDNLGRPNKEIRGFLVKLQTWEIGKKLRADTVTTYLKMLQIRDVWKNPGREHDVLFDDKYEHRHQVDGECHVCGPDNTCDKARKASCKETKCDLVKILVRNTNREDEYPLIHFGAFSSADQVIKSSTHRKAVTIADGAIGFEMEGAGVWDNFPTIIVKGVCDYADSHKNKNFQRYAAATAAACSKAILKEWERGRTPREQQLPAAASVSASPVPTIQPVINNNFGGAFTIGKIFNGGNFTSSSTMTF